MSSEPICLRYLGQPGLPIGHGDLELSVGKCQFIADTYYFLLDAGPQAPPRLGSRIAGLLNQWLQLLDKLKPHESAYLPWDFSDQCTGWIRVTAVSGDTNSVLVEHGRSSLKGWSFYPSDIVDTAASIRDWTPMCEQENTPVETELEILRAAINRDRERFANLATEIDRPSTFEGSLI
ncbi:hypothetical protein NM208_g1278 [Fusarium decemcellulare]|uniref:Uncharacterized protein n=1 Tax=Fusarium decemcellulare TaxID=57161 RepID=A0ACC1SWN3_9HYPO|nr:hypothetical protein NM208_g1278 [Fusarium decemcellulare]